MQFLFCTSSPYYQPLFLFAFRILSICPSPDDLSADIRLHGGKTNQKKRKVKGKTQLKQKKAQGKWAKQHKPAAKGKSKAKQQIADSEYKNEKHKAPETRKQPIKQKNNCSPQYAVGRRSRETVSGKSMERDKGVNLASRDQRQRQNSSLSKRAQAMSLTERRQRQG